MNLLGVSPHAWDGSNQLWPRQQRSSLVQATTATDAALQAHAAQDLKCKKLILQSGVQKRESKHRACRGCTNPTQLRGNNIPDAKITGTQTTIQAKRFSCDYACAPHLPVTNLQALLFQLLSCCQQSRLGTARLACSQLLGRTGCQSQTLCVKNLRIIKIMKKQGKRVSFACEAAHS